MLRQAWNAGAEHHARTNNLNASHHGKAAYPDVTMNCDHATSAFSPKELALVHSYSMSYPHRPYTYTDGRESRVFFGFFLPETSRAVRCACLSSPVLRDDGRRLRSGERAEIAEVLHLSLHPPPLRRAIVRVESVQKHLELVPIDHPERALMRESEGSAGARGGGARGKGEGKGERERERERERESMCVADRNAIAWRFVRSFGLELLAEAIR